MNYLTSGNDAVDQIGMMNLTGNIIPQIWYRTIVGDTGKPHYLAIAILADVVYWYRPTEIRDERSGQIIGWKKKFSGEMLQRNYESIASQFGESEKTVIRAVVVLEKLGVLKRHRKTIKLKSGLIVNNVLFLELKPDRLYELTYPSTEWMDEYPEERKETEWTNLSGRMVRTVRMERQKCPAGWTNPSGVSDKTVQADGQNDLTGGTNLSERKDKSARTNTENTIQNITENPSIYLAGKSAGQAGKPQMDVMDEVEAYTELIREHILYDQHMAYDQTGDREIYHELYKIICDIVCIPREKIWIGGQEYPYPLVKAKFLKLDEQHLLYVMECMKKTNTKISNIRSYMTTALYRAPDTINCYYQQEVQHDLYG